jgi:hypothetical protein
MTLEQAVAYVLDEGNARAHLHLPHAIVYLLRRHNPRMENHVSQERRF